MKKLLLICIMCFMLIGCTKQEVVEEQEVTIPTGIIEITMDNYEEYLDIVLSDEPIYYIKNENKYITYSMIKVKDIYADHIDQLNIQIDYDGTKRYHEFDKETLEIQKKYAKKLTEESSEQTILNQKILCDDIEVYMVPLEEKSNEYIESIRDHEDLYLGIYREIKFTDISGEISFK